MTRLEGAVEAVKAHFPVEGLRLDLFFALIEGAAQRFFVDEKELYAKFQELYGSQYKITLGDHDATR